MLAQLVLRYLQEKKKKRLLVLFINKCISLHRAIVLLAAVTLTDHCLKFVKRVVQ